MLVSLALALGTAVASVAVAGPASAAVTVGKWELNEAPGAHTALDTSGNHLNGTVGSDIQTGVKYDGATAYRFPTWATNAAGHEVIVPNSAKLNPEKSNFSVSVRMRTARYYSNVVQKGQDGTSGGYWKVEVARGEVTCQFNTGTSRITITSGTRIDNGKWHSVRCGRSSSTVSLYVDGVRKGARSGLSGSVANTWEMAIGGKSRCDNVDVGCDFFAGDVDYVRVQKG